MLGSQPTLYMIAGPNGAGKSTLYHFMIKSVIKAPFINADVIQKFELPDQSMEGAYKAARLAEERRQNQLADKKSFVSESTFSHPSKVELIESAQKAGFRIVLYYVSVGSPDISVERVSQRVSKGGHNVPENKIRARYQRNQSLIKQAITKSDLAFVFDNSQTGKKPCLAMALKKGVVHDVSETLPSWVKKLYADELKIFSLSVKIKQSKLCP